jgi:hypothetical protein
MIKLIIMNLTNQHALTLSKLNLPDEVIDLIKDFAFDNETTINSKKNKNEMLCILNTSVYIVLTIANNSLCVSMLKFKESHFIKRNQIRVYCFKCGEKIFLCRCDNNDLLLLEYSRNNINEFIIDGMNNSHKNNQLLSFISVVTTFINILILIFTLILTLILSFVIIEITFKPSFVNFVYKGFV